MNKNIDKKQRKKGVVTPLNGLLPAIILVVILLVFSAYTFGQRKRVINNAEQITNQMAEYVATNISNEIHYAESSIKLSAVMISQTMTSEVIENPSETILPMVANTPFGSIEYIRADGMNVMNIGEPFDASDRVYYIEGIKGNTGVWNNYHPKVSKETLVNFYTPLMYNGNIAGVITGYIEATGQLAPLFDISIYDEPVYGILVDENNMVICSTLSNEFEKDLTLDMLLEQHNATDAQKERVAAIISEASNSALPTMEVEGEGRISVAKVPGTDWKAAVIVPAKSFNEIVSESTMDSVYAIAIISLILILYAGHLLISNFKRREEVVAENIKLEEENEEIRDIIASANMGIWKIEMISDKKPRMYVDDTMKKLLGTEGVVRSPEDTYTDWYDNITPDAVPSVLRSVEKMQQGYFDENTYLWKHPTKGVRYVRCGGTAETVPGGFVLRGYHYDVDDVVREDQAKVVMLENALNEKNEYYSTLGALGDIFYSMHVIDLTNDTATEFTAKNNVKEMANHSYGAREMMAQVMRTNISDGYRDAALEFSDLSTIQDRIKGKKILSGQFLGNFVGWILASFITMEADDTGRPTKVIFTTRSIDEEKKQEERLIRKTQTDELTGLLNRRAYEEDIYEHNDTPEEDEFIYVSLDVNGLKVINDTMGHIAGDELIVGACHCMRKALGPYGRLYRIGGDEFVAILFCNESKVKTVLADFDETIANWSGKLVDGLSISYGWISKEENSDASVRQLGAIAEQRMYEAKSEHYKKTGVDRRGQQEAHKVLCGLYTKILKINITDDSYQIINMDGAEQTKDKGFSADSISEWLISFGEAGLVHPDDLEEYLRYTDLGYMRSYFSGDKTSLHIFYRRKFGDVFKQVMMELIPAGDYTSDNQSLFLYVKNIEK